MKDVRKSLSEVRKQESLRIWNETQAQSNEFDLDVEEQVAPVPRQMEAPRRFYDGFVHHVFHTATAYMYRQRFYDMANTVRTSLDDGPSPEMLQHLAHTYRAVLNSEWR